MSQLIAIANQKGGVGKTTLTIHLSAFLAQNEYDVIVIDGDSQANATSWLLNGQLPEQSGLFQLLVSKTPARQILRDVEDWKLRLIPSNSETGDAMKVLVTLHKPIDVVGEAVAPLREEADFILLDMPPSNNAGFQEMLYAADWVLIPTLLERPSIEGVHFMVKTLKDLDTQYGKRPRLLGIVPNMVRQRTIEHTEQLKMLADVYGARVWPPIPLSVRVGEAWAYGETLFEHAPNENVTEKMEKVMDRFRENVEVQ